MPWDIVEKDGRFCVREEATGKILHCYDSRAEAREYQQALYSHADDMSRADGEKSTQLGEDAPTNVDGLKGQFSVGDFVKWNTSGGTAYGRIVKVTANGRIDVPGSTFEIVGTPENPAALIAIYRKRESGWIETDILAGHRFAALAPAEKPKSAEKAASDDVAEHLVYPGSAVKSLGKGRVGGYLVVWGDPSQRDLQGEYFSAETDLGLDWYDRRPALYHHGLDATLKAEVIGVIDTLRPDETGLWAEAQLDLRKKYVQAVEKLVKRGALGWSSGSLPHLVDIEEGHIRSWPICEGSLTPTPAQPVGSQVRSLKTYLESLVPPLLEEEGEDPPIEVDDGADPAPTPTPTPRGTSRMKTTELIRPQELIKMTVKAITDELGRPLTEDQTFHVLGNIIAKDEHVPNDRAASTELVEFEKRVKTAEFITLCADCVRDILETEASEDLTEAVKGMFTGGRSSASPRGGAYTGGGRISVMSRYHDLDARDMSYLFMLRNSAPNGRPWAPDKEFYRELAAKCDQEAANNTLHLRQDAETSDTGQPRGTTVAHAVKAIKTDEVNYSTQTGFGDEWVPTLWSDQLWRKARLENAIMAQFERIGHVIDMPSNPFELPIESTDPTVYFVNETKNEADLLLSGAGNPIPDSKLATGKVTLSAGKLGLRVGVSAELEEDSIIRFIRQLRNQAERTLLDALDNVLLNGDTTTGTGNINFNGASIAANDKVLVFEGLLHVPLIDTTANKVDAGNVAPTLALLRTTRSKLNRIIQVRPDRMRWLVGPETHTKMLNIDEVQTIDKYGPNATVVAGELSRIDGIPMLVSAELALGDGTGVIDGVTPANNTQGRGVLFAPDRRYVGFRRRIKLYSEFMSYFDSWQITATVRIAFVKFDADSEAALVDLAV